MKLYSALFITWVALFVSCSVIAQDIGFSQFYEQPLLRNPALAGIFTGDVRLVAAYRNQWQNVTIPYRTFGLSAELKLPTHVVEDDNFTVGLQLVKDIAGTSEFSTTQVLPAFNYSFPLSSEKNSYLSLGFMGGLMQQRFDPTKLVLNDQFVAGSNGTFTVLPASRQVFDNTNISYFDLSYGLSYNGSAGEEVDYFIGAGFFHVTKPKVAFFEGKEIAVNKKFTFNAGISLPTGEQDRFILYGDYFGQGGVKTFQAGMMYGHDLFVLNDDRKRFTAGVLYRWDDAVIPVVQLELSRFIIGTSYDINISKLVIASHYRGGLELTLAYRNFLNNRSGDRRQTRCPRFGNMPGESYLGY